MEATKCIVGFSLSSFIKQKKGSKRKGIFIWFFLLSFLFGFVFYYFYLVLCFIIFIWFCVLLFLFGFYAEGGVRGVCGE